MSVDVLGLSFFVLRLLFRASPLCLRGAVSCTGEGAADEYLLSMPVLRTLGGCGKFAMLTDRLTSFSDDVSPPRARVGAIEAECRVGMFGLDAAWLALGVGRGLVIFEGVRRASFEGMGFDDGSRDDSDVVEGVRIFDMGS